jgi:hypothetical protein
MKFLLLHHKENINEIHYLKIWVILETNFFLSPLKQKNYPF